jgi:hypothetical protein
MRWGDIAAGSHYSRRNCTRTGTSTHARARAAGCSALRQRLLEHPRFRGLLLLPRQLVGVEDVCTHTRNEQGIAAVDGAWPSRNLQRIQCTNTHPLTL